MARAAVSRNVRDDWEQVLRARHAVQDARTLIERLHALFEYQGVLLRFVDKHWVRLDQWADRQP
jgi:hypothetical protein